MHPEYRPIRCRLVELAKKFGPLNPRGLAYRAHADGLIGKTSDEFSMVERWCADLRKKKLLDPDLILDSRRSLPGLPGFSSLSAGLANLALWYRRSVVDELDFVPFLVLEKSGLADVIDGVCADFGVPLIALGGYGSITTAKDLGRLVAEQGKPLLVMEVTDYDADGEQIVKSWLNSAKKFAQATIDVEVRRVALTSRQVEDYGLPSRPQKAGSTRAVNSLITQATDLDALIPSDLQDIVRQVLTDVIPADVLRRVNRLTRRDLRILRKL